MIHRGPNPINGLYWVEPEYDANGNLTGNKYDGAGGAARVFPQAYKDISADPRKKFDSFFSIQKRSAEHDAYKMAHTGPNGIPGVINLGVLDNSGAAIPFAPFEWNGRQMMTDAKGIIKYIEKDYFQNAISLENERVKYVTQMISLVVGQPAESVIGIFGYDFYRALAGCDSYDDAQADYACKLYATYLNTAGIPQDIAARKLFVFKRYSNAEASPEVMCNYGDNDPDWSKAFNKLSMLIEYHPSAIVFDKGTLDPLDSSGTVSGDLGRHNAGPPDALIKAESQARAGSDVAKMFRDSNRKAGGNADISHPIPLPVGMSAYKLPGR